MIKALLLIFRPVQTWGGIDAANRSIAYVLCVHLLPLLLLTSLAEGYGLMTWGRAHKGEMTYVKKYEFAEVVIIEAAQVIVSLALIPRGLSRQKIMPGPFIVAPPTARRSSPSPTGFRPMFLLRLGDLISGLNAWVPLGRRHRAGHRRPLSWTALPAPP
jgi:hypothetical protein